MFKKLIGGKQQTKNNPQEFPSNFNPTKSWAFFGKLETVPDLCEKIDSGIENALKIEEKHMLIEKKDFDQLCKEFERFKEIEKQA